jgi:hypothetical protein
MQSGSFFCSNFGDGTNGSCTVWALLTISDEKTKLVKSSDYFVGKADVVEKIKAAN